ncbi:MAG TPA: hypothetical protein VHR45_01160 [Thermoanaerobaculia bacterium]|nr:hypothetical protein [Thermoanaerobaculia bacterium]
MVISQAVRRVLPFALLMFIDLGFDCDHARRGARAQEVVAVDQPLVSQRLSADANENEATEPFWAAARIHDTLRAFRKELPGRRRALNFYIDRYGASLEVQDPDKPENVDEYRYDCDRGVLHEPTPVRGPGLERYHLFDWDEVLAQAENTVPPLVDKAITRLGLEGGVVVRVYIYWGIDYEGPIIQVNVDGARKNGWVEADMRGNVIQVEVYD